MKEISLLEDKYNKLENAVSELQSIVKKSRISILQKKYRELKNIVSDLEGEFDRNFTLDGHLIGSFGEMIAHLCYGVKLNASQNEKGFDGMIDGKKVEIRTRTIDSFSVQSKADYLLCFQINKDAEDLKIEEVYNGPTNRLEDQSKPIQRSKLIELSKQVKQEDKLSILDDFKDFVTIAK